MANISQPIAEAVVKVKLDPASLDLIRNQLKGLNQSANINGISGGNIGKAGSSIERALVTGIGTRLGSGSMGSNSFKNVSEAFKSRFTELKKQKQDLYKELLSKIESEQKKGTPDYKIKTDLTGWRQRLKENNKKVAGLDDEIAKEQSLIKQTREFKKQESQLRTNLSLMKTSLDTVTRTVKYMTTPIVGLGIFGFSKYLETMDSGAINLRKAIGGLLYSWNQFLARVGDTISKSYTIQKIIENIRKFLDGIDEKKIKMLFNFGAALIFLFVVTKILTAFVQMARILSSIRGLMVAINALSISGMFTGGGAAVGGVAAGAGMAGIGGSLSALAPIIAIVVAALALLAGAIIVVGRAAGDTGSSMDILKKFFADFVTAFSHGFSDAFNIWLSIIEACGNMFKTIGDFIKIFINIAYDLFKGDFLWNALTNSFQSFADKFDKMWVDWQKGLLSIWLPKKEEEKKKYVFSGTTTTTSFAGLNKLAQDLADNTMLMAADKMEQAADKIDKAADKMTGNGYNPDLKVVPNTSGVFGPSFATF